MDRQAHAAKLALIAIWLLPLGCAAPPAPPAGSDVQPVAQPPSAPVIPVSEHKPADAAAPEAETSAGAQPGDPDSMVLEQRFDAPTGFERIPVEPGSFGEWLRRAPLLPAGSPVLLHTEALKPNQAVHAAVLDFDVGTRDLQQCADAVMRLRAEYLMSATRAGEICFRTVKGEKLRWQGSGMRNFRSYLDKVFAFANSASLLREMDPVRADQPIEPGDVFIQPAGGGAYGHAVIVMDAASDRTGRRIFLLAQSYMPAQSIHLLVNRREPETDPWYADEREAPLVTPEWTFAPGSLRRFRDGACAG